MAINYLNSIDLNKNQLQNGVSHVLATAPSNPVEGQIYYNSTDNRLYFYDATNWIDASGDIKSVTTQTANQLDITDPEIEGFQTIIPSTDIEDIEVDIPGLPPRFTKKQINQLRRRDRREDRKERKQLRKAGDLTRREARQDRKADRRERKQQTKERRRNRIRKKDR